MVHHLIYEKNLTELKRVNRHINRVCVTFYVFLWNFWLKQALLFKVNNLLPLLPNAWEGDPFQRISYLFQVLFISWFCLFSLSDIISSQNPTSPVVLPELQKWYSTQNSMSEINFDGNVCGGVSFREAVGCRPAMLL